MFGVFISLDLMLYYGFWELSLVPMAILIAMYGRKEGAKAAQKNPSSFTFIPSAPLLVAILCPYTKTGTFDFAALQALIANGHMPANALCWAALRLPLRVRRQSPGLPPPRMARRHIQ